MVAASIWLISCQAPKKPLVVATYAYSTNDRIDNLKPLAAKIGEVLGQPVETKSYPDVATFIQAIRNNEVDVALINTFGYLLLALDNQVATPIAAMTVREEAKNNYKTVLLASAALNLTDAGQLKERADSLVLTLVAEGSTSGNLVPRLFLSSVGLQHPEIEFQKFAYAGNHTKAFELLLEGNTDLCAFGSNEYFKQVGKDSSILNKTRVLWMSEEIPLGPVLIKNTLAEPDKAAITDLLLNLHTSAPEAFESVKKGWSEAANSENFAPVDDSHYDTFRDFNGKRADLSKILRQFNG